MVTMLTSCHHGEATDEISVETRPGRVRGRTDAAGPQRTVVVESRCVAAPGDALQSRPRAARAAGIVESPVVVIGAIAVPPFLSSIDIM